MLIYPIEFNYQTKLMDDNEYISSLAHDPGHVKIVCWPSRELSIVCECKIYLSLIDTLFLRERVERKFCNYPACNLFLAAASRYADIRKFFDPNICVWVIKRIGRVLQQESLNTLIPTTEGCAQTADTFGAPAALFLK